MSAIRLCYPCAFKAGTVVVLRFSGGGLTLLPAHISIHELLCQMFRWFDEVFFATVAKPAYDGIRPCLRSGMTDDSFICILFLFCSMVADWRLFSSGPTVLDKSWSSISSYCVTRVAHLILTEVLTPSCSNFKCSRAAPSTGYGLRLLVLVFESTQ